MDSTAHMADQPARESTRQRFLLGYVILVDVAALAALAALPFRGLRDGLATFMCLAVLSALVGSRPVHIPRLRIQVVALELFVFCSLLSSEPLAAPLVALAGVTGAVFGPRRRPLSIRTAFNLGALPLSAALAALVFDRLALGNSGALVDLALPLGVATIIFHLSNTLFAAVAISIESRRSLIGVWWMSGSWTAITCCTSAVLAVGLTVFVAATGPAVLVLALVMTLPLLAHDRLYGTRVGQNAAAGR